MWTRIGSTCKVSAFLLSAKHRVLFFYFISFDSPFYRVSCLTTQRSVFTLFREFVSIIVKRGPVRALQRRILALCCIETTTSRTAPNDPFSHPQDNQPRPLSTGYPPHVPIELSTCGPRSSRSAILYRQSPITTKHTPRPLILSTLFTCCPHHSHHRLPFSNSGLLSHPFRLTVLPTSTPFTRVSADSWSPRSGGSQQCLLRSHLAAFAR